MKTQRILKVIRFCLPTIMVVVWSGTTLYTQERPRYMVLWQNGGLGQRDADTNDLFPTQGQAALKLKFPNTAAALSWVGTLAPQVAGTVIYFSTFESVYGYLSPDPEKAGARQVAGILMLSGSIFGPSAGYFYGDCADRAWKGLALRIGFGIPAAWGWMVSEQKIDSPEEGESAKIGTIVALVAMVPIALSANHDVKKVKDAVREHNRSLQEKALTITPAFFAQHGAPGVKLQIRF